MKDVTTLFKYEMSQFKIRPLRGIGRTLFFILSYTGIGIFLTLMTDSKQQYTMQNIVMISMYISIIFSTFLTSTFMTSYKELKTEEWWLTLPFKRWKLLLSKGMAGSCVGYYIIFITLFGTMLMYFILTRYSSMPSVSVSTFCMTIASTLLCLILLVPVCVSIGIALTFLIRNTYMTAIVMMGAGMGSVTVIMQEDLGILDYIYQFVSFNYVYLYIIIMLSLYIVSATAFIYSAKYGIKRFSLLKGQMRKEKIKNVRIKHHKPSRPIAKYNSEWMMLFSMYRRRLNMFSRSSSLTYRIILYIVFLGCIVGGYFAATTAEILGGVFFGISFFSFMVVMVYCTVFNTSSLQMPKK